MSRIRPKSQSKKSRRRRLTDKEKKFLKYRGQGMTLARAATKAGYSEKSADRAGSLALERISQKAPELFARHGLDDDTYIEKHLFPLLRAREVKVFNHNGRLIYSKPLAALGVRARMVELLAEIKGMKVKEQETARGGVKVLIVNGAHRPVRRTAPAIDVPATEITKT